MLHHCPGYLARILCIAVNLLSIIPTLHGYDNERDEQELFKSFTSVKTLSKIADTLSLYTTRLHY